MTTASATAVTKRRGELLFQLRALIIMLQLGLLCLFLAGGFTDISAFFTQLSGELLCVSLFLARHRRWEDALLRLCLLLFSAVSMYAAVQLLSLESFVWHTEDGDPLHLYGFLWVAVLYLGVYALCGRMRLTLCICGALMLGFGTINYTLELFRGRPFMAIDVTSLRTALSVTGSYSFSATPLFIAAFAYGLCTLAGGWLLCEGVEKKPPLLWRLLPRLLSAAACCAYLYAYFCTSMVAASGLFINWDDNEFEGSSVMYFVVTAQKLNVRQPEGYSDDALSDIAAAIPPDDGDSGLTPNIIVIMSEAFSDLSVIGDFETTEPVTPFTDSLKENTVRGLCWSSVLGGNTANSEYEFLTGDTMAFVPTGSVPYQLYINYETDTLVSALEAQGYSSFAQHPYLASGWNRVQVYDLFGFDRVVWKDDYSSRKFLRNYVSDACDYTNLIRWFEEKEPGQPVFFFNITIQNHGSYKFEDFESYVQIKGREGEFPQAEQYLTLLNITDKANETLFTYFEQVEEPTVILFFGDHQPKVDEEFYDLLYGHSSAATRLTLEEQQRRYATPFLIWANYDIEERDGVVTSLNALSSLLLETAGLKQTGYQRFLGGFAERWPAINANGVMDGGGVWHSLYDEYAAYDEQLAAYRILQYNHLFDPSGYRSDIFSPAG